MSTSIASCDYSLLGELAMEQLENGNENPDYKKKDNKKKKRIDGDSRPLKATIGDILKSKK